MEVPFLRNEVFKDRDPVFLKRCFKLFGASDGPGNTRYSPDVTANFGGQCISVTKLISNKIRTRIEIEDMIGQRPFEYAGHGGFGLDPVLR